jgi:hypothetical protein
LAETRNKEEESELELVEIWLEVAADLLKGVIQLGMKMQG